MIKSKFDKQIEIQREYYRNTAENYTEMHIHEGDEHYYSLKYLEGMIDFYGIKSVLDIGAGTGRVANHLKKKFPNLILVSVEPVEALREEGYKSGLSMNELVDGDASALNYKDKEFDLVCAFGVMHHIPNPQLAINEMLRVCKRAIFISDGNNFGQGTLIIRTLKQFINLLGLWSFVDFIKTKGKGYTISDGDGLAYSYSVFNNYSSIRKVCKIIHITNTMDAGINPYRTASHVALLGVK